VRILIVDDSLAMTAIVRRSVIAAGIESLEIETARSGAEGLDCLQRFKPDLVLTDWHMPGMSGLEMVQNMRQMGFTDTRVGFITTEAKPELLAESKRNGADFVLNKPFRDEELWELIRKFTSEMPAEKPSPSKPVGLEDLIAATKNLIKLVPFRMVQQEMTSADLTDMNLLALYYQKESKTPVAIGVMEIHSVIIVGAGTLAMQPAEVKKYITSKKPTTDMQAQAAQFLEMVAGLLQTPLGVPVHLQKQSLVNRDFPKLQDLLTRNRGASFFRIDIPGYGSGRMSFILV
jgi:CheY-like chemotaxis protein